MILQTSSRENLQLVKKNFKEYGKEGEQDDGPVVIDSAMVSRVRMAPNGKPFAIGLAIVIMSG